MDSFPWLTTIGVVPLVGAVVVVLMPAAAAAKAKVVGLAFSLLTLVATIVAALQFDTGSHAQFQLTELHRWIPQIGTSYSLGVDGIALVMILLSVVLTPICLLAAWHDVPEVGRREQNFVALVLGNIAVETDAFGSSRIPGSASLPAIAARTATSWTRAMAARLTRASGSSRASESRTAASSSPGPSSSTEAARTSGSADLCLGWILKRSRKDMGSLTQPGNPERGKSGTFVYLIPRVAVYPVANVSWLLRFLCQPVGDALARPMMVVVDVDEHRCERQTLITSFVRAAFRDLVETAEQPLEMVRNQLPVLAREVVDGVVHRPERARSPFFVEITAETLWSPCRTGANVFGQFALFALELGYHRFPPARGSIVAHQACPH